MIKFYKKHGMLVYWLILLVDCYDSYNNSSENGYYIKGLLFLSAILYLVLNFTKRRHTTSKWLVFAGLTINVIGSFLILQDTLYPVFLGYCLYGIAIILFITFLLRLIRHEELSSKEAIIVGVVFAIAGVVLIVKTKVDFGGFNYFAYAYGIILCTMVAASVQLLGVKNKRNTAITSFIPAGLLMCGSGIIQIILRVTGEAKGLEYLRIIVLLCSGYAIALIVNGAKKILK